MNCDSTKKSEVMEQPPVLKLVNHTWKTLPTQGDDVYIKDPKLKEGYIGDLTQKSVVQLEEIITRHDRILNNKILSSKLKDKGEKLRECRQKVAEALQVARQQNISKQKEATQADIHAFEWNSGIRNGGQDTRVSKKLDSDDDDDDDDECEDRLNPLKLMAYHSSCVKKPTQSGMRSEEDPTDIIIKELKSLDLQDAEQDAQTPSHDFGSRRMQMLEEMKQRNGPVKDSFKPFKPIKNPQPIPGLQHHISQRVDSSTVCISQQESLELEREFLKKEKERALADTREQLRRMNRPKIGLPPPSSVLKYRDTNLSRHLLDSDEDSDDSCLSSHYENFDEFT